MNSERDKDDLIELGAASLETRGPTMGRDDSQGGLYLAAGLNDE